MDLEVEVGLLDITIIEIISVLVEYNVGLRVGWSMTQQYWRAQGQLPSHS